MEATPLPRLQSSSPSLEELDRLGWPTGVTISSNGARIGIRVNDPPVLELLPPYFPPGWKWSTSPTVDALYSLVIGHNGKQTNFPRLHLLYSGATRLAQSTKLTEIFDLLESDLHFSVAQAARRRLFIHAGVVAWRGRAIVLPGRSMTGKTSLVAALVRAGATYYSDEYAVFDDRGWVHPYAKPLSVREEAGGRPQKYSVEALGGRAGTRPLPVGLIINTTYQQGARWRPRAISPADALVTLLANTVLARFVPDVALPILRRVALDAAAWKSRRGQADQVTQSILGEVG